jgi:Ca-activated chloride channel family protein
VRFEWPLALAALAVVPVVLAAYLWFDRRRARDATAFASAALMPNVVARAPGWRRHLPTAAFLLALVALSLGFARPHADMSVPREEATVVLAMDVSRSMNAKDVFPTRLAAAQEAARRFLDDMPESFRVGVVTFATTARVAAPATADRDTVRQALEQIRPGEGTALSEAMVLALRVIRNAPTDEPGERPPASVLLISDGAQTQGEVPPRAAAQRARRAGVPVYTVALGTPEGIVEQPAIGGYTEQVRVPPDPATLRLVARTSGGEFFDAPSEERLRRVYDELGSRLGNQTKEAEVTVAFAGIGAAFLLVGGALSTLLFRRLP